MKIYPDISKLLQHKAARRRRLAQLSFEEKIAIVNRWRRLSLTVKGLMREAKQSSENISVRSRKHG
jgi:hypothetical protein